MFHSGLLRLALVLPVAAAFLPSTPSHCSLSLNACRGLGVRLHESCGTAAPLRTQRLRREGVVGLKLSGSANEKRVPLVNAEDLEAAFVQMDKDKSGELSREEVRDVLEELGYTGVESKCLFDHMDIDQNGKITQTEFVKGCVSEGICAIDDDASNYEGDGHPVVSNNEGDEEENITMLGFYQRLLQYTSNKKVLGEAGQVRQLETEEEFDQVLKAAGDKPVVVKFFAEWCRKCIAMAPKYKKIAAGYGEQAIFVKLNIEKFGDLAKNRGGVVAIPTFMVFRDEQPVDKYVAGSVISKVPGELAKMIDKNLACGFSLLDEILVPEEKEEATKGAKVELGKAEVNMDAMAAWRAAQAAKGSRRM